VCVCSCTCTRCSAVWHTCTLRALGVSVCVAVHVPGVPQPGIPTLSVRLVCVCSCTCTRCSTAWHTYTLSAFGVSVCVCVAVHVPGVPQPGIPALSGRWVCLCVAVHVPGVPQSGIPALAGRWVCVCVCSCTCTRCSAVWHTCTLRAFGVSVYVCVAVHVPGVPQPGIPALSGRWVCLCVCV